MAGGSWTIPIVLVEIGNADEGRGLHSKGLTEDTIIRTQDGGNNGNRN